MKSSRIGPTLIKGVLAGVLIVLLAGIPSLNTRAASMLPAAYFPTVQKGIPPPSLSGCGMFPADNIWNRRIDSLPVHPSSATWVGSIGLATGLHPDFGANWDGGPFGIPFNVVAGSQPRVNVSFYYNDQSDPGPYPIPPNAIVEKGSDHHVLVLDQDNCVLYETWDSTQQPDGSWTAGSGAIFPLGSNLLRPATWTSADAAGLPILPGLLRWDEVTAGAIRHAIRFTANSSADGYIWPARHKAPRLTTPNSPPMGARFRLKASVDISGYDPQIQVIFRAFKEYGLILADNGSNWYISGEPDARWNDDLLVTAFKSLHGSSFEAIDESSLMVDPNSAQSR